jgi:tetratricopeptide (TPR) repeat protein
MTGVTSRSLTTLAALLFALSGGSAAQAQETGHAAAVKLSDEASALYQARDYKNAIDKFQRAYAADPDPNLIYNIAKCYEALGDNTAAIDKYQEFLRLPGGDSQGRVMAEESVRTLRRAEAAKTGGESQQPARTSYLVPTIIFLGAGAAAMTVGAIVYVTGVNDHNEVTSAANYGSTTQVYGFTESRAQSLVDSGDKKKLVGGVVMGFGGALLATSLVFFVLDRSNRSASTVGLGVAPTPGGAAFSASGRF